MNYWIQSKKAALLDLLERVDVLMVNDSEARELSGDWNIHRAGSGFWRAAQARRHQAGRARGASHRAEPHLLRSRLSARERLRSYRRGRRVRRRIHGATWPAPAKVSDDNLRRAMVYGATMGSYAVEQFGIRGVRVRHARGRGVTGARLSRSHPCRAGRGDRVTPGVRRGRCGSRGCRGGKGANRPSSSPAPGRSLSTGRWVRLAGWCGYPPACGSRHSCSAPTASAPRSWSRCRRDASTASVRISSITASTTFSFTGRARSRSWTTSPARGSKSSRSPASSRASPVVARHMRWRWRGRDRADAGPLSARDV